MGSFRFHHESLALPILFNVYQSITQPVVIIDELGSPITALKAVDDADEITKKYGLEAGLFSIFKSGDKEGKGVKAKDLLAKYGSAYLITSISLSLVSFGLCYVLINAGVDVTALLNKVKCG